PTRTLLLLAGQLAAVEVEAFFDERLTEQSRRRVYGIPAKVGLPVVERNAGEQLIYCFEKIRGNNQVMGSGRYAAASFQIIIPGKSRGQRLQLLKRHLVIEVGRIAA